MTWRAVDSHEGLTTWIQTQPDGSFLIRTSQDVELTVEANKARQTDGTNGYGKTRELRHVATIPDNMVLKWLQVEGVQPGRWMRMKKGELMSFYRKYLNDPDYRYLKTVPGRV